MSGACSLRAGLASSRLARAQSVVGLCVAVFLVLGAEAQAQVMIDGPAEGRPGQALAFRLLSAGRLVGADTWAQLFNPDRYLGNDYVTSFALQLTPQPDGTVIVVAPAPGRYKIAASAGGAGAETHLLIRPDRVVPEIRGASLSAFEPLDRPYVSEVLGVVGRLGMTWVDVVETAWIDFDSGDLTVQPHCVRCPGSMSLDDVGWLIDEAHRQGLRVSVNLGVWARSRSVLDELQAVLGGVPLHPSPWPSLEHRGPDPTHPSVIPVIMQSYKAFALQMATLAQQHGAEAILLGNNTSSPDQNLLWTQQADWTDLFARIRQVYQGRIWKGFEWTCPGQVAAFVDYSGVDVIQASLSGDISSTPRCTFPLAGPTDLTAEQLAQRIAPEIDTWRAFVRQAASGLPVIYTDFYTVNVDGLGVLGGAAFARPGLVQDNQEVVDLFEAAMRTVGQRPGVGVFLWSAGLSRNGFANSQDPLKQPALANAIANWWGGDTAAFAPCLAAERADVLFRDDFDRGACPLERQNLSLILGGAWRPGPDAQSPTNTVLHGPQPPGVRGDAIFGLPAWSDYAVGVRARIVHGAQTNGMVQVRTSNEGGFSGYGVHLGQGQVRLFKSVRGPSQMLASHAVPGGTTLGRWYRLEVSASGATIDVYLDGELVLSVSDANAPLVSGPANLGSYGADPEPAVDFDDVLVVAVRPREFVRSFYQLILGRSPSVDEVLAWGEYLAVSRAPAAAGALAHTFLDGPEFTARGSTPAEYVALLYRAFLGREPEPAGLDGWVAALLASFHAVLPGFVDSPEFRALVPDVRDRSGVDAVVRRLYEQVLGRVGAAAEVAAWTGYVVATADLAGVARAFFDSQEYNSQARTLAEHVTTLYRTFLARDPSPAEVAPWVEYLVGRRGIIADGFIQSPEFQARFAALFR